ncbi:hypothetical protein MferCBS31731_005714 [Microsporum ferrugineum]
MASQPNSQPEAVPESSKRGGTSSAKSPILGEVTDETNAEIIALTPWLQTATEFMVRDDGLMVYSNRQIFEERFRSLLEKVVRTNVFTLCLFSDLCRDIKIWLLNTSYAQSHAQLGSMVATPTVYQSCIHSVYRAALLLERTQRATLTQYR